MATENYEFMYLESPTIRLYVVEKLVFGKKTISKDLKIQFLFNHCSKRHK